MRSIKWKKNCVKMLKIDDFMGRKRKKRSESKKLKKPYNGKMVRSTGKL